MAAGSERPLAVILLSASSQDGGSTTTTSTTTTTAPYLPTGLTSDIDDWRGLASSIGLALLVLVGIVVVVAVVWRVVRLRRTRQLVVTDFVNAIGEDMTEGMDGFTAVARVRLSALLAFIDHNLASGGFVTGQGDLRSPLPRAAADTRVNDLLASVESISSKQISGVVQAITQMIAPSRVTTITGHVVRRGLATGRVGVTVMLADDSSDAPRGATWWEPEHAAGAPAAVTAPGPAGASGDDATTQFDIAEELLRAGLYGDVVSMVRTGLARAPGSERGRELLARALAKEATQRAAAAKYAVGDSLRASGQLAAAVVHLVAALRSGTADMSSVWRVALELEEADRSDVAAAWVELATRYDEDDVLLHDESLSMLAAAARLGSALAERTAMDRRAQRVRALGRAGELARQVGMLADAEAYANQAAALLPGDDEVARLLAAISSDPRRESPDAVRAALSAGLVYEQVGDWAQASASYLKALDAQPEASAAAEGLARAACPEHSMSGRVRVPFSPTLEWLSVEISRHELGAALASRLHPRWYRLVRHSRAPRARAQVVNFAALLFQSYGWGHQDERSYAIRFLDLAIAEHRRAIAEDDTWPVAHESLGDSLARRARLEDDDVCDRILFEARQSYQAALTRLTGEDDTPARRRVEVATARAALRMTAPSAQLKKSVTQVIMDNPHALPEHANPDAWSEHDVVDADFLYNVASLYGLAVRYNLIGEARRQRGRRLLACSIVRDRPGDTTLLEWAAGDDDIVPLFPPGRAKEVIGRFGLELARARSVGGDNRELKGHAFKMWLDGVLESAGWEAEGG